MLLGWEYEIKVKSFGSFKFQIKVKSFGSFKFQKKQYLKEIAKFQFNTDLCAIWKVPNEKIRYRQNIIHSAHHRPHG